MHVLLSFGSVFIFSATKTVGRFLNVGSVREHPPSNNLLLDYSQGQSYYLRLSLITASEKQNKSCLHFQANPSLF